MLCEMIKTPISVFLVLIHFYLSCQDIPNSFTLNSAIEWGMDYNKTIQKSNLELQKAYKEKWKTISIGLPQIRANLSYQNFLEQPVSLIPAEFFGGTKGDYAEVVFGTEQTAIGFAEINQLLFDGTYIIGVQGLKHYIDTAKNVLEKSQIEIKKSIIIAYVNTLVAEENISVIERNLLALNKNLKEITAVYKNGFSEEEDVEQIKLTISKLRTQFKYAKESYKLSFDILKLLLGVELDQKLNLSDSLEYLTMKNLNYESIDSNYSNNIDIRLAENKVIEEKFLFRLEKAKGLPSLSAFLNGSYVGNSNEFTFTDKEQKWFGSSAFGLRLEVPIFSSFGRHAKSQKAKLSLQQAEKNLTEVKSKVYVEMRKAQNNFNLAKENYFTAIDNLKLAERIEKKNIIKFFEGVSGSFQLTQAQQQLYQAQQSKIQSMRAVIIEKTNLENILNNKN